MALAALRTAQVVNVSELGRDAALSTTTARSYLSLLETSYPIRLLPAFAVSRGKRLTKAPKLHLRDTALAWHLSGMAAGEARAHHPLAGAMVESYVVEGVASQLALLERPCRLNHWRSHGGAEVDMVVEVGTRLLPVEIKQGSRIAPSQLLGLHSFLADYPEQAPFAIVLYGGEEPLRLHERILALPWHLTLAG
jgi:predicted AAA+ superfamily ATPase